MKYRLLFHRLSHTIVVLDISEIGLPDEVYPPSGKEQMVPSRRFQVWEDVERYLLGVGANANAVLETSEQVKKAGFAALTIAA
jgi:hypothetical protein